MSSPETQRFQGFEGKMLSKNEQNTAKKGHLMSSL